MWVYFLILRNIQCDTKRNSKLLFAQTQKRSFCFRQMWISYYGNDEDCT